MVGEELALEIRVLAKHGKGFREIAREVGVSHNAVRRYLCAVDAVRYRPPPAQSVRARCSALAFPGMANNGRKQTGRFRAGDRESEQATFVRLLPLSTPNETFVGSVQTQR